MKRSKYFSNRDSKAESKSKSATKVPPNGLEGLESKSSRVQHVAKVHQAGPDDVCGICLSEKQDSQYLDGCKHSYCMRCIELWGKIRLLCPLCKVEFNSTTCSEGVVKIFDKPVFNKDDDDEGGGEEDEEEEEEDWGYEHDDFVVPDTVLEFEEGQGRDYDREIRREQKRMARARRRLRELDAHFGDAESSGHFDPPGEIKQKPALMSTNTLFKKFAYHESL